MAGAGNFTLPAPAPAEFRMLDFCIFLFYRAGSALVSLVSLRLLYSLGKLAGLVAWATCPGYRTLAQRNLAIAFGKEKSARELRELCRQHFQRLGANLISSVKLGTMPLEQVASCVTLENAEVVHASLRAGQPVVLVLSHMGSWELFAQLFPKYFDYVPLSTVYQAIRNRFIDADIQQKRARAGVQLFDRRDGFQRAIALLRKGGLIGILSDQHAGDQGLWTPFFGRLASSTPLPGLLAKRTHAAVIGAAIYTDGPARWRMVFTPRIDRAGDSIEAITARTNEAIAAQIRVAPNDWFWVHNRWKTPRPRFLLTNYKRGIYLPAESAAADLQPFRILLRAPNWLGDSVMSTAAVRAIKQARPDAHITVAAPANLAPVWKLIPEVDEVIALPSRKLFATARLLKRQRAFEVAIVLPNSLRSALEIWLAGVPRRVGFRGHNRSWFLNQIVPDRLTNGPIEHQENHFLHLARELGAPPLPAAFTPVNLPNESSGKIALCPGAEYGPAKRWLPERFAEVAQTLGGECILFGTEKDAEIGQAIEHSLGEKCLNRIGKTSMEELIAELRECRLLLTNDTGTMHLAALLGVRVVAIFGSTEDRLTGPLGAGHTVIRHHVPCSPCFLRECPLDFRCMNSVTSEEVTAAVRGSLDRINRILQD